MTANNERVLVCPRDKLDLSGFRHFTLDVEPVLALILNGAPPMFLDRALAEADDRYKQIIPYVVLRHEERVFTYFRGFRGTERRLVGFRSIGLGGHIQEQDWIPTRSASQSYEAAIGREVHEEVHVGDTYARKAVAIINDESSPVGRVHLGILHVWELCEASVGIREDKLVGAEFVSAAALRLRVKDLERWSQIALDVLWRLGV